MARGTAKSSLHTTQLQTLAQVNGSGRAGAPEALLTKAQAAAKRLLAAFVRSVARSSMCFRHSGEFLPPWIRPSCDGHLEVPHDVP